MTTVPFKPRRFVLRPRGAYIVCSKKVFDPSMVNFKRNCKRKGVIYREGKYWCRLHAPYVPIGGAK